MLCVGPHYVEARVDLRDGEVVEDRVGQGQGRKVVGAGNLRWGRSAGVFRERYGHSHASLTMSCRMSKGSSRRVRESLGRSRVLIFWAAFLEHLGAARLGLPWAGPATMAEESMVETTSHSDQWSSRMPSRQEMPPRKKENSMSTMYWV